MKANLNPGTRERESIEIHFLFEFSLNFLVYLPMLSTLVLLRLLKAFPLSNSIHCVNLKIV